MVHKQKRGRKMEDIEREIENNLKTIQKSNGLSRILIVKFMKRRGELPPWRKPRVEKELMGFLPTFKPQTPA